MTIIAKSISSIAVALIFGAGLAQNELVRLVDSKEVPREEVSRELVRLVASKEVPRELVHPVAPKEAPKEVVEILYSRPDLSMFLDAVKASGVEIPLRRSGPWTVLAPTNDAFKALPKGTFDEWSKPENRAMLAEVIGYHVIRGRMPTSEITTTDATTLQGSRIVLKKSDGTVWVGRGEVLVGDLEGTNGVIHVINMVLDPNGE
jgi:uncharacterized surface protein with fasciclin (FAS1) repeats